MSSSRLNLKNYSVPLEEINLATENFSPQRCIGGGGFGYVYRGQLSKHWQDRIVAIKRLAKDSYQGEREFRNEVEKISGFHHENIISFVGYCDEENEKIIVYEYATNGSLDHHLKDQNKMCCITWVQRLKICLEAARGLNYLHVGRGEHNSVIHRDIKSANILLDDNMVAKICDFGLSRSGTKSHPSSHIYTKVAGTQYYIDPTYIESNILRQESDVYSFGVVLFEMLSGMLVYQTRRIGEDMSDSLIKFVRRYYHSELHKLIDPNIIDQISYRSFYKFNEVACKCISYDFKKRPTFDMVIKSIEQALDTQLQENVSALIECVQKDQGFSHGKPVAAFTIYKCLLHWNFLEAESPMVFKTLIAQVFPSAIEYQKSNEQMAYWLSCASNLLFLIQKSKKLDGGSTIPEPPPSTMPHEEMIKDEEEVVRQVQVKKPALHFMDQLTEYVENIYNFICDDMIKELQPLLASSIEAPQTFEGLTSSRKSFREDSQFSDWQGILDHLNNLLKTMKENYVPPITVQKILAQVFSYINTQLFNSLLTRHERCTFKNGEFVKAGLAELELWCSQPPQKFAVLAWDELQHIRQAIEFLVKQEKHMLSYDEITNLFQILSIPQLHRLCTIYRLDPNDVFSHVILTMKILMRVNSCFGYCHRRNLSSSYGLKYLLKILCIVILYSICTMYWEDTHNVSSDVIIMMKIWMKVHSSVTYLLTDSSRKTFNVDDLYTSLQVKILQTLILL
ncbi:unnamed protein product [Lactuca virosa]|uniref:non-specific serine/threonine protein kinase n=1 Tax=Lactuca virosa TaxID=75947 RepID=A0AAU9NSC4_9ASTR|nr:unnamed protein product [Lactuca virosa]